MKSSGGTIHDATAARAVQLGALLSLALAAGVLGYLFLGRVALVGGSLIVGVIWSSFSDRPRFAAPGAAGTALAGLMLARRALGSGWIAWLLENGWGRTAVPGDVLAKMLPSSAAIQAGTATSMAAAVIVSAGTAWLASVAYRAGSERRWITHVPAAVALAVIIAGMLSGASAVEPGKAAETLREPGSFQYDAAVYRQTHALMVEQDLRYYEAFITAASHDARLIEQRAVKDGQFVDWATSPNFIRLPYIFWVWEGARSLGLNAYRLSMLLAGLLLAGSYWAFWPLFGSRSVIFPALLYPWFVAHATWVNLFFPDYWAALFGLGALMVSLRERWVAAGMLALAAALCREVAAVWLVILLAAALASAYRNRERRAVSHAIFYTGCLGVFAAAVYFHHGPASEIVSPQIEAIPVVEMLTSSAARPLYDKFVTPAGHVMYPYGFFLFSPALLALAAPFGFWLSLRRGPRRVLLTLLAASLFWPAFTLTIGAPSSYWGQYYSALGILGTTALFAWAAQESSRR